MLQDQYPLECQIHEEVAHVLQLLDFGAPATADQRLFCGTAAIPVTVFSKCNRIALP